MSTNFLFPLGTVIVHKAEVSKTAFNSTKWTYIYVGRMGSNGDHIVTHSDDKAGVFYRLTQPEEYVEYVEPPKPPEEGELWVSKHGDRAHGWILLAEVTDHFVVFKYYTVGGTAYYTRPIAEFVETYMRTEDIDKEVRL